MVGRRSFMASSVALGTISIAGSVNAKKEGKVAAVDVGLGKKLRKLLREHELEKAINIMDRENIEYYNTKKYLRNSGESSGVSTQDYKKSSSSVSSNLLRYEGSDRWLLTGHGKIRHEGISRGSNVVDDAFALSWDNSEWTSPDMTNNNFHSSIKILDDNGASEDPTSEYEEYNEYGVLGTVDIPGVEDAYPDFSISAQTDIIFRKDYHEDIGAKFEYEHTWASLGGSIDPRVVAGGLSVSLPRFSGSWRLEGSTDPDL